MARVVEINNIDELDHYHMHWSALWRETPGATFFQTLDWLKAYWRHFGAGQRLRVLIVYSGGQPIGIAPLVVRRETTRLGRIRTLTYPLHDWGSFYGPVGSSSAATLAAVMLHLQNTRRDWDMLDLRWIDRGGADRGRTANAMRLAGLAPHEAVWKENAQVDTSAPWQSYFAGRTSKFRNNVRRSEKQLAKQGEIELLRYRPRGAAEGEDDPRWDLFDTCIELAGKSWQGGSTNGTTLSHQEVVDFFRDAHLAAARAGALDVNLLKLDGRPIAFGYNYHSGGCVQGLRMGFDPQFSGAGTVLYARMIEESCNRGDSRIDLGPEYLEAKRHWLTEVRASHRCTYYPPTAARAQLLRLKHWMFAKTPATEAPAVAS